MSFLEWLSYFGIPTLIFASMFTFLIAKMKKYKAEQDAIRNGIQALLRAEMIKSFNKYTDLGYAPIYAKENFENVYKNYHSLGLNGVMDGIRKQFMELPTERREEHDNS